MTTLPALQTETAQDILKRYPVCEIARVYAETTQRIVNQMGEIEKQKIVLQQAFRLNDEDEKVYVSPYDFDISFRYHSKDFTHESAHVMLDQFKRDAWRVLVAKLGLRNIMSVKKRKEFDQQLESGDLPEITEETITAILLGLCGQAQEFAKEAAVEVFGILRPQNYNGGQHHLKTNNPYYVGKRVILPYRVQRSWNGSSFRPNYHNDQEITAIDGVFHLLDGQGVMRENRGPLYHAIEKAENGIGETDYFRFKCFKNGNLHLEFRRLDLVKELNFLAAGQRILGHDD